MPATLLQAITDGTIPNKKPKGKGFWEPFIEAGMEREDARNIEDVFNANILIDATKGVQYIDEIMELVIQAFEEACMKGPLAKEKVTGMMVKITDAKIHEDPVHRGPAQILPAVRNPIYAAMLLAGIRLLEPKQKLLVQAPQDYMSAIISQIQGRRGQVLNIEQEGEIVTVNATVPVAEMFGFSNSIRGATQGRAIWYTEYAGFEPLNKELQQKIVYQVRERKGEPTRPEAFLD